MWLQLAINAYYYGLGVHCYSLLTMCNNDLIMEFHYYIFIRIIDLCTKM